MGIEVQTPTLLLSRHRFSGTAAQTADLQKQAHEAQAKERKQSEVNKEVDGALWVEPKNTSCCV